MEGKVQERRGKKEFLNNPHQKKAEILLSSNKEIKKENESQLSFMLTFSISGTPAQGHRKQLLILYEME